MKNLHQETYNEINLFFESTDIDFMNHGYYPPHPITKKTNIIFKNQFSLYLSLFDNLKIENKNILEIGCGRGGGIKNLNKYYNFKEVHACDLNKKNIEYCNKDNSNIKFKISDAENLDYKNNLFDIVINVESSHCYENPELFFNEVKRVLKPDGIFLYTDVGKTIRYFNNFHNLFKNIYRTDITENVLNSCKDDIKNFKNLNVKNEVKEWMISLAKYKYNEYLITPKEKYLKYVCSDSDDWFNK